MGDLHRPINTVRTSEISGLPHIELFLNFLSAGEPSAFGEYGFKAATDTDWEVAPDFLHSGVIDAGEGGNDVLQEMARMFQLLAGMIDHKPRAV